MIEMFVNNKPLVLPSDLKIRVEINSPAFESDVIPSSIVYYFNVPVTQDEEVFNYANYVEVKNKYREYNWKMRFEGFWIFSGKLIVTRINSEFRCAASIKQLPTEFGDRNITDFTYDRILLGSKSMKEYVNEVREQKSFTLSFPSIYAPNLYGEGESADNQDFGKIVNAMNIENTSSNVNTVIPCFHAMYVIETMFKSEGYQILNSFDHSFKELLLFNNYTLDQLPVENYAFSNLVGKTNLTLTVTDAPTNSIRFNKYYTTPGEYEISIFAKAKFTSHSNPENTQMIVEASMVYTAYAGNTNGTRKEINRVKVEYDPNHPDKIDVFIDICFTQIFEHPGENWLYFEIYAYNSKGSAILRNYEITEGYIEIRRINSSTTDLNTYMKEINPVNHLPEISCSDFLLSFKQLLGFIYLFDFTNKTLQIVFMKDLLKTKVLDLTEQYLFLLHSFLIKNNRPSSMQRYKQNINNVNIHKIITGVTIVLLPMLYRLDHCFTGLSAASFLLVFFSLALIPRIIFRENYSWRKNDTLVVLFLCWGFTRYFTSPVLDDTFILFDWLAVVIVYTWTRNSSASDAIFPALFAGGIVQSAWGILQFMGYTPSYHAYFEQTGSFNTPALWGIYLAMAIFGGVRLFGIQTKKGHKMLVLVGITFVSVGMVLAHSRAAWVALACGLAWTFLKSAKKSTDKKWNKKVVLTTVAFLLLVVLAFWGIYLIRPDSAKGRLLVYAVSLSMFRVPRGSGTASLPSPPNTCLIKQSGSCITRHQVSPGWRATIISLSMNASR